MSVVDSGAAPTAPGLEGDLDLAILLGLLPASSELRVVTFDPYDWVGAPYLAALDVGDGRLPSVISSSTDFCEPELAADDIILSEWVLAASAASGVSVVVAAGDHGSSACYPPDPSLAVQYPASSAYVTSVGGTQLEAGSKAGPDPTSDPEIVWLDRAKQAGGGGGQSQVVARPRYQDFGIEHRRVPDVAALADPASIPPIPVCDPKCRWTRLGGTSAGAPVFAAGVATLKHEVGLAGGVAPGLFNPLLYGVAESDRAAIGDITSGTNGLFVDTCCAAGVGFDEASGWGVISFDELRDIVLALGRSD